MRTANVHVLEHPTLEELQWCVEAQHFIDGAGNQGGVRVQSGELLGVSKQGPEAIASGIDAGFMARIEEQDTGADQFVLGQTIAGFDDLRERADEVVLGIGAAFARKIAQVVTEFDTCGDGTFGGIFRGMQFVHATNIGGPGAQLMAVLFGNAEQLGDDGDGQRFGEGGQKIEFAEIGGLVDERVHDEMNTRAELFDGAGGECFGDEIAEARVIGRFTIEHSVADDVPKGGMFRGFVGTTHFGVRGEVQVGASEAAIAEEGGDVGVAGDEPEIEAGVVMNGAELAKGGINGVGVGNEGRGGGVEGGESGGEGHGASKSSRISGRCEK